MTDRASALASLRDYATMRVGYREMSDLLSWLIPAKVRLDASENQVRFWCPVHGRVVPLADRYDCPRCVAFGSHANDYLRGRVVSVVDRATGMLALNPS